MKKTKLLSLSAIFAILTLLFCVNAYAQSADLTIYIDQATTVETSAQNGTKDAPYSKIETALAAVKNTESDCIEVFIMSDYQQPVGGPGVGLNGKTVKFTAESNETKFNLPNGTLYPAAVVGQGTVEFDNITIVKGITSANDKFDIDLRGFNLTLGENAKVSGTININQIWATKTNLDNQLVDIKSTQWPLINVNIGNYAGKADTPVTGISTVNLASGTTIENLGVGFTANGNTSFFGTQNYIIASTVRNLHFGKGTAQKGKRYVQVNGGGILDIYTTGDATGLTADSLSGVNVIEINGGVINKTGNGSEGGVNKTEPENFKKINVHPNNPEAWENVTRVVIFNDNKLTDVEVTDTAAIVLRVAAGGKAQAVTTEPTAENNWDCELLGFEVTLPEGKDLVYVDGVAAVVNEDGLYVIEKAGESKVTFGNKYTVTIDGEAEKYAPGTKIALPEAPEKENAQHYTFKWSDGENEYDAGAEYTVNGNVTFTESWTAKTYTVKFVNGEDVVFEEALAYDSTITAPEAPAVDGHTFDGWFIGEEKFEEGTKVTGEVTYTAKYSVNSYDIEINAVPTEGGSASGAGSFEYGTKIILTATPNFGYNFDGWYIGEEKVGDATSLEVEVKNAVTYIAKFITAPVEIKASIVLAREEGTPYNVTYEDGTAYNNGAKLTIYDGEEVVFEGSEAADGTLEFTVEAELGKTYRVVVIKNGYLTYDEEIEIKTGNELSAIELVPGDIKADYDDISGDGKIDIDDFIRVLRGFSEESPEKLRNAVDINEDRTINVTDLGYIKAALNK